jgi:hypothetical protein
LSGEEGFKEVFEAFITEARKLGYGKGKLRILDATHDFTFSRGLSLSGLLKDGLKRVGKRLKEKAVVIKEKARREILKVTEVKGKVKVKAAKAVIKQLAKELRGRVDEAV